MFLFTAVIFTSLNFKVVKALFAFAKSPLFVHGKDVWKLLGRVRHGISRQKNQRYSYYNISAISAYLQEHDSE